MTDKAKDLIFSEEFYDEIINKLSSNPSVAASTSEYIDIAFNELVGEYLNKGLLLSWDTKIIRAYNIQLYETNERFDFEYHTVIVRANYDYGKKVVNILTCLEETNFEKSSFNLERGECRFLRTDKFHYYMEGHIIKDEPKMYFDENGKFIIT